MSLRFKEVTTFSRTETKPNLQTPSHSVGDTWARTIALSISLCVPSVVGIRRSEGQEPDRAPTLVSALSKESNSSVEGASSGSASLQLPPLSVLSGHKTLSSKLPGRMNYETALQEHQLIFGENSPAVLIWPDHHLSYEPLGGKTTFSADSLRETLQTEGRRLILDGTTTSHAFEDSISTVRATTSLLGPAAFPMTERSPESPSLIAVVGFDSARPRSIALKSLAGITCPTFMFTRLISRQDLHTFVRFHESGHVFQHLHGRVVSDDIETPYERCRIEAEADVFAALWWQKTHSGDTQVPRYFLHLRSSNFIESAASGNVKLTLQYSTALPLKAAIERGESLWESAHLRNMSSYDIYCEARSIVSNVLPSEYNLTKTIRELHNTLSPHWGETFTRRSNLIRESVARGEVPEHLHESILSYLNSIDYLSNPSHLTESYPHLSHASLAQLAREVWLEELAGDLSFSNMPALVMERYEQELSSNALAVWRLSITSKDGDGVKDYIKNSGSPKEFFVPSEQKSQMLSKIKEAVLQELSRSTP